MTDNDSIDDDNLGRTKQIENRKQKWIAVELNMGGRSITIIIKTCEKNVKETITKCKNPNQCTWSLFLFYF